MKTGRHLCSAGLLLSVTFLASVRLTGQEVDKPLPDLNSFLLEVRKNLRSDRLLLSQYTFTEKVTIKRLDKSGKVSKTEVRVHEVYPSLDEEYTYRRLISKDGKPLSAKELEEQDRDQDKKLEKRRRKLESMGQNQAAREAAREAEERRKEEKVLDELIRIYDIKMLARERVAARPAIILSFQPRPGYTPKTDGGKILSKAAGKAWFGEDDHQLIRAETRLVDSISVGLGIIARLNEGATAIFERTRVNDEIWLPAAARFAGNIRLLLFKGLNIEVSSEYSDYRKFTVRTSVEFPSVRKQ